MPAGGELDGDSSDDLFGPRCRPVGSGASKAAKKTARRESALDAAVMRALEYESSSGDEGAAGSRATRAAGLAGPDPARKPARRRRAADTLQGQAQDGDAAAARKAERKTGPRKRPANPEAREDGEEAPPPAAKVRRGRGKGKQAAGGDNENENEEPGGANSKEKPARGQPPAKRRVVKSARSRVIDAADGPVNEESSGEGGARFRVRGGKGEGGKGGRGGNRAKKDDVESGSDLEPDELQVASWKIDLDNRKDRGSDNLRTAFSMKPCSPDDIRRLDVRCFLGERRISEGGKLLFDADDKVNLDFLLSSYQALRRERGRKDRGDETGSGFNKQDLVYLKWLVKEAKHLRLVSRSEMKRGNVTKKRIEAARKSGKYALTLEANLADPSDEEAARARTEQLDRDEVAQEIRFPVQRELPQATTSILERKESVRSKVAARKDEIATTSNHKLDLKKEQERLTAPTFSYNWQAKEEDDEEEGDTLEVYNPMVKKKASRQELQEHFRRSISFRQAELLTKTRAKSSSSLASGSEAPAAAGAETSKADETVPPAGQQPAKELEQSAVAAEGTADTSKLEQNAVAMEGTADTSQGAEEAAEKPEARGDPEGEAAEKRVPSVATAASKAIPPQDFFLLGDPTQPQPGDDTQENSALAPPVAAAPEESRPPSDEAPHPTLEEDTFASVVANSGAATGQEPPTAEPQIASAADSGAATDPEQSLAEPQAASIEEADVSAECPASPLVAAAPSEGHSQAAPSAGVDAPMEETAAPAEDMCVSAGVPDGQSAPSTADLALEAAGAAVAAPDAEVSVPTVLEAAGAAEALSTTAAAAALDPEVAPGSLFACVESGMLSSPVPAPSTSAVQEMPDYITPTAMWASPPQVLAERAPFAGGTTPLPVGQVDNSPAIPSVPKAAELPAEISPTLPMPAKPTDLSPTVPWVRKNMEISPTLPFIPKNAGMPLAEISPTLPFIPKNAGMLPAEISPTLPMPEPPQKPDAGDGDGGTTFQEKLDMADLDAVRLEPDANAHAEKRASPLVTYDEGEDALSDSNSGDESKEGETEADNATEFAVDPAALSGLLSEGFKESHARKALRKHQNNKEASLDWLVAEREERRRRREEREWLRHQRARLCREAALNRQREAKLAKRGALLAGEVAADHGVMTKEDLTRFKVIVAPRPRATHLVDDGEDDGVLFGKGLKTKGGLRPSKFRRTGSGALA